MKSEEAGKHARAEADRLRTAGAYPPSADSSDQMAETRPDLARLREWAIIEVDKDLVYSTRKGGAPITWFKRMLLQMLRQYTTELEARQTRFNVAVVAYLERLEKRD